MCAFFLSTTSTTKIEHAKARRKGTGEVRRTRGGRARQEAVTMSDKGWGEQTSDGQDRQCLKLPDGGR